MENAPNKTIEENDFTIEKREEKQSWFELRDIVFAAVAAAAILVIGFITVPLVIHIPIPGIRNVVSAPFSAMILTIGAARIQKSGSLFLILGLSSLVYLLISLAIPAFVLSAAVIAELVNVVFYRGYAARKARLVCVTVLYTCMTPLGTLFGALLLGGKYQEALSSVRFLLSMTGIVLVLSFFGALAGEKIVKELKRAGKLR